ncbi:MAG: tetratricopeptide repeat protein, partial [Pyrinomonadaceae bacterium]
MKNLPFCFIAILLFAIPAFAQNDIKTFKDNAGELSLQGKFNEAITEINKAIALQPNDADLILKRAELQRFAENNQAFINDVQKAVLINPSDKKVLYSGALLLHRAGNYEQALKICSELFALGEPDVWAWQLIVRIKTHLEDFVGAFEDVSKAIELFPENAVFRQNQANLIRLMG